VKCQVSERAMYSPSDRWSIAAFERSRPPAGRYGVRRWSIAVRGGVVWVPGLQGGKTLKRAYPIEEVLYRQAPRPLPTSLTQEAPLLPSTPARQTCSVQVGQSDIAATDILDQRGP
jgi:hypothetical protein